MKEDSIYIIPVADKIAFSDHKYNAAVFVVLYYEEKLDSYKNYLLGIPEDIDVYIISSKDQILESFGDRYIKVKKKNRGRDISGLLIAARPYIFQYEYICFIHDKKEKSDEEYELTQEWERIIWESLLASGCYIYNLLYTMESRKEEYMGVMLPFYAGGSRFFRDGYKRNIAGIKALSQRIGIEYEENDIPETFATCFWARTVMLEKLFSIDWKYEDFPDPTVNDDGDLNHSIERIFRYLLKDRGKEEAVCISDRYMAHLFLDVRSGINLMWDRLNGIGITDMAEFTHFSETVGKIRDFSAGHSRIFIYGTGEKGLSTFRLSENAGIKIDGFIVSSLKGREPEFMGFPVVEYGKEVPSESGIIIGVGKKLQSEIISTIENGEKQDYLLLN